MFSNIVVFRYSSNCIVKYGVFCYVIDNLDADYNYNALKKAESHLEMMFMSDSEIYDQLVSEYGEKFTPEQAQYAIDHRE